jgi:hypothetical protein
MNMPKQTIRKSGTDETSTEVSDVLITGGIVIVGGIALYSIATILGDTRALAKYTGGGAQYWANRGDTEYKRITGAPRFWWTEFWNQTTGQEGLGWTNRPEGSRAWWHRDPNSNLWGWGWKQPPRRIGTGRTDEYGPDLAKRREEAGRKSYWAGEEGWIPDFIY